MPALRLLVAIAASLTPASAGLYDCKVGRPETWSQDKRDICCIIQGVPCPERHEKPRPAAARPAPVRALTPPAEAQVNSSSSSCKVGEPVTCPGSSPGVTCAGTQCCAGSDGHGSFVCPSAPAGWNECQRPKRVDCVPDSSDAGGRSYRCDAATADPQAIWEWPQEKKHWCCKHKGVGCPPITVKTAAKQATGGEFNCHALLADWAMVPADQKSWCCEEQRVGCPAEAVKADCDFEYFLGKTGSNKCPEGSSILLEAECRAMPKLFGMHAHGPLVIESSRYPRGCFTSSTVVYFNVHPAGAPVTDKTPYCKKCRGVGPASQEAGGARALEYNCQKDLDAWQRKWPGFKKMWCCANEQLGCPDAAATSTVAAVARTARTTTPAPTTLAPRKPSTTLPTPPATDRDYDCEDWKIWLWSDKQKDWCCKYKKAGCGSTEKGTATLAGPAPAPHPPAKGHSGFNCALGNGMTWRWPQEKQQWCCAHHRVACSSGAAATTTATATTTKFVVLTATVPKRTTVPAAKEVVRKGESTAHKAPSQSYDCDASGGNADRWDAKKRHFCCKHKKVGCPGKEAGGQEHDCLSNVDSAGEWSSAKKDFCCKHFTIGCAKKKPTEPKYSCTGSKQLWSPEERTWCCEQRSIGCSTDSLFDLRILGRFNLRHSSPSSLSAPAGAWPAALVVGVGVAATAAALAFAVLKALRRRSRRSLSAHALLETGGLE